MLKYNKQRIAYYCFFVFIAIIHLYNFSNFLSKGIVWYLSLVYASLISLFPIIILAYKLTINWENRFLQKEKEKLFKKLNKKED